MRIPTFCKTMLKSSKRLRHSVVLIVTDYGTIWRELNEW